MRVKAFPPFAAEWQHRHAYQGKPVKLLLPDGATVKGTVAGVDAPARWCSPTVRAARASCPAKSRCAALTGRHAPALGGHRATNRAGRG